MRFFIYVFLAMAFIACKEKAEKSSEMNIVKQSEMAALMLEMYKVHESNKQQVLKGEKPSDFPVSFLNIHTATLTDPTDRNEAFKDYSDYHLREVKILYEAGAKDSLVELHNNVVNSCITCHQSTCIGPIPRIKKLLIR